LWKNYARRHVLDAESILRALTGGQVEFVVVGGLAMITHGSAHVTEDLDICYRRTADNITRLVAAIAPLKPYLRGAPPGLPFRVDSPTITAGLNFTLTTEKGPLDLLGEIGGVGGYTEVLAESEPHEVFGFTIRVLSLDALIAAKKNAGRSKDRIHLLELLELKKLREAGN
jgi:hypothetical protein